MCRNRGKYLLWKGILKVSFVGLISLLIFVTICNRRANADGIIIDIHGYYLNEPGQKAVVIWDKDSGEERLILNTSFGINSLSDFCWIIPVPSSQEPTVEPSDNEVFDILKEYFLEFGRSNLPTYGNDQGYSGAGGKGLSVIEIKEIESYDLAILWANDPKDLTDWLIANGYSVPSGFKNKVKTYTDMPNGSYFIANKIDMGNKFAAPLAALEAYAPGIYDDLMSGNIPNWDLQSGIYDLVLFVVNDIKEGMDYSAGSFVGYVMSKDEYEELQDDWDNGNISNWELYTDVRDFIRSTDLFQTILDLFGGAGTPLEITFFPEDLMYPLYISSLAENFGKIYVYVFAPYRVKDKNGVLDRYDSISLSSSLESKLADIGVTVPDSCRYVTLLIYEGYMDNLDDDAFFVEYRESAQNIRPYPYTFPSYPLYPFTSPVIDNYNPFFPPIIRITPDWIATNLVDRWNQSNRPNVSIPSWSSNPIFNYNNYNYFNNFSSINPSNWNSWNRSWLWKSPFPNYSAFGYGFRFNPYGYQF